MLNLTDKVCLVTGATRGIGKSIAQKLGAQGAIVIGTATSDAGAESISKALSDAGIKGEGMTLNVSDGDSVDAVLNAITEKFGAIAVLVNNAGIQYVSKLEEFPADKWQLITNVLLVGPAMMTKAVLPLMRANNFGRIINIGSLHGLVASPYKSAYVAAKHGIIGFSKVIALETGDQDITINTICPAYVKTPFTWLMSENEESVVFIISADELAGLS